MGKSIEIRGEHLCLVMTEPLQACAFPKGLDFVPFVYMKNLLFQIADLDIFCDSGNSEGFCICGDFE